MGYVGYVILYVFSLEVAKCDVSNVKVGYLLVVWIAV